MSTWSVILWSRCTYTRKINSFIKHIRQASGSLTRPNQTKHWHVFSHWNPFTRSQRDYQLTFTNTESCRSLCVRRKYARPAFAIWSCVRSSGLLASPCSYVATRCEGLAKVRMKNRGVYRRVYYTAGAISDGISFSIVLIYINYPDRIAGICFYSIITIQLRRLHGIQGIKFPQKTNNLNKSKRSSILSSLVSSFFFQLPSLQVSQDRSKVFQTRNILLIHALNPCTIPTKPYYSGLITSCFANMGSIFVQIIFADV